MSQFKVVKIIDGETVTLTPTWQWTNRDGVQLKGENIKVAGYKLPKSNDDAESTTMAKLKLNKLLLDQYVDLKSPMELSKDGNVNAVISCRVYLNGVDISKYFPEFQES